MAHRRFPQLRTPTLLRVHVSDHGLCPLIDVHMLDPNELVTAIRASVDGVGEGCWVLDTRKVR
jgi:hypothetical protein